MTAIPTRLDLNSPRTIGQILKAALQLYARLPLLFIFLAGIVVVPFEIVVVLLAQGKGGLSVSTNLVVRLVQLALIDPFIAALQVQVLLSLASAERPRIADVIRRGLAVLAVVAAAEIIAGIGIAIGALFFIIPGVILAIRWAVVAQVAAVERTDWPTALRRSAQLARQNYWRILAVVAIVTVLNQIPADVTGTAKQLGLTIAGMILALLVYSFGTLLTSFLYFDLRARESAPVA